MPRKCPCGTRPYFNLPREKTGVCCSKCKTTGMIDVVNNRCSCGKQPCFNVTGKTFGICCSGCKTDDMINVVNKKCSCGSRPSFNVSGQTTGICCVKCKTDDMIDVKNKRCPCGKRPVYNVPGQKTGIYCSICKTDGMINVVTKVCSCGKRPKFNVIGQTVGICCVKCKTDEMTDVVNKICPGYNGDKCPVRTYIGNGHKYCLSCDPNDARRKLLKWYEEAFFDYVKDKIDVRQREFRVTFDQNETSKKFARLDGIVFGDGIVVCLEVDENGHRDYECDEHRMHLVTAELLQMYPDSVVSWVRVNPTTDEKTQTSKKSQKIREQRFEDAVSILKDMLKTRVSRVVYIGFDDM